MFTIITLLATVASTGAIAIPQTVCKQPTTGGIEPPFPLTIGINYYQSKTLSHTDICGQQVDNGTIEAEACTRICHYGIAIAQAPDSNCSFTLFRGTVTCDHGATEMVSHQIPKGDGSVCIPIGVEDECSEQGASGVWSCG